ERFEFADGTSVSKFAIAADGTDRVTMWGTSGDDVLIGGKQSNFINAGSGNDTLDVGGYTGSWQHLRGEQGNDTYLIGEDDGQVWITQYGEKAGWGTDTVVFKDLTLSDLTASVYSHDGYGESLRLSWDYHGQHSSLFLSDMGQHIERFEFADGTVLREIKLREDGRIELKGTEGDDVIIGGEQNDYIHGGSGDDILDPGAGN
ncbi:calcium-binding protein, partial [Pseudovibrio exalbescens]